MSVQTEDWSRAAGYGFGVLFDRASSVEEDPDGRGDKTQHPPAGIADHPAWRVKSVFGPGIEGLIARLHASRAPYLA